MASYAALAAGTLALGMILLRRWRSSAWGRVREALRQKKLSGKVVVVTGGSNGLGLEVVRDMARRGATVVVAARNQEVASNAISQVKRETGNKDINFLKLDLASLESVRKFTAELTASFPQIDALVLNAGVWVPMEKKMKTEDGFEIHAGVNHLGHFLLTNMLTDKLGDSGRVVVVSSALMNMGKLNFTEYDHFREGRPVETRPLEDKEAEKKRKRMNFAPTGYCDTKLMNALFAKTLSQKLAGSKITAVAVCPGFCYTHLHRYTEISFFRKMSMLPILALVMRSAARGAENIVQAVLENEEELVNGGFYRECKLAEAEMNMLNGLEDTAAQLWQISESLTTT